jgi:hypothetical protein
MATYANHLELFAEQIGPTGEQLGNVPQVFTHLVVINAAISLDDPLNRSERVGILLTWEWSKRTSDRVGVGKRCGCHKETNRAVGESAT